MKNKNKVSYQKLFKFIFQKTSRIPEYVIFDLETAVLNTIKEIFPSTNIRTCQFHYSQTIWRNIQKHNLSLQYKEDERFDYFINSLISLSYVPSDKIIFFMSF
ncbi:hypothetical protein DMUE_0484 [Dictyocoela muelleri]|nr:hypothetical protein DMUE_0484 [Dictyocoela muelleri]